MCGRANSVGWNPGVSKKASHETLATFGLASALLKDVLKGSAVRQCVVQGLPFDGQRSTYFIKRPLATGDLCPFEAQRVYRASPRGPGYARNNFGKHTAIELGIVGKQDIGRVNYPVETLQIKCGATDVF